MAWLIAASSATARPLSARRFTALASRRGSECILVLRSGRPAGRSGAYSLAGAPFRPAAPRFDDAGHRRDHRRRAPDPRRMTPPDDAPEPEPGVLTSLPAAM